jgi:hypothetical protein
MYLEDLLPHTISGTYNNGASVVPSAEVRAFAMLLLLTAGNYKEWDWGVRQWYNVHENFC